MNLHEFVKTAEKLSIDNSPAILTAVGVAGTVTTAILSARAAVEANDILRADVFAPENDNVDYDLTLRKKVELTWKVWVLPVSVGTITITSIVFANRIGTRRAAAMATAYVISEKAFDEYREKVVKHIGENKERVVRDEIAQDHIDRSPNNSMIVVADTDSLCYEQFTGRYFVGTVEKIKKAINDTNYQIMSDGYASVNDFFDKIDVPSISFGEEVGWNSDKLMDVLFATTMSEAQKPCISIDFTVSPIRGYNRVHG